MSHLSRRESSIIPYNQENGQLEKMLRKLVLREMKVGQNLKIACQ